MSKFFLKGLFLFMISAVFLLAACNDSGVAGNDDDHINIKLSFNLDTDSSHGEASQLFKERVEELSDGKINVDLFPNQQLGDMRSQIEQVQSGTLEMTLQGTSTLSNFAQPLEILELPFLFPNEEVAWEVLSGEVGKEILSEFENKNLVGLSYFSQGFRQITANQPIHSPEDLESLQIRTMPSKLLLDTWENWGANTVSMDLGELYNGLQQGIVEAEDNSYETIRNMSLYEVQDHLTISNHNYLPFAFVANKNWYDGLSPEFQNIVKEAALEAGEFSVDYIRDLEKEAMEVFNEELIVYELTEKEIEVFREYSEPIYEKYSENKKNKDYIDKLVEAVEGATSDSS